AGAVAATARATPYLHSIPSRGEMCNQRRRRAEHPMAKSLPTSELTMPKSSNEHDRYVLHLNQALAMESALVDHLEKRAAAVPDDQARERILQHRDETIQHRETVRDCIQAVGG